MGLLFNRKTTFGGRTVSSPVYKKRIADVDISKASIKKVAEEMGFTHMGAEHHFKKFLMKAQEGGLTREEFHKGMQDMIVGGYVTKKQAMHMTREAGIERKDLRHYKDISEWDSAQGHISEAGEKKQPVDASHPIQDKGKIKTGSPVSQNGFPAKPEPAQPGTHLSSANYAQSLAAPAAIPTKEESSNPERERSIYDIIRKRNQKTNQ